MQQVSDYRSILQKSYRDRLTRNPAYSLRSYARDLTVSPSMLSEVLSEKKNLTRKTADKIVRALNLSHSEQNLFLLSVDLDTAHSGDSRAQVQEEIDLYSCYGKALNLKSERTAFIADPNHLVLISLTGIQVFRNSLSWLAEQLGVFQHEANRLLTNLKRLKILEELPDGSLKLIHQYLFCAETSNAEAVRTFHRATLHRTLQSISAHSIDERDFYTSIFAIDQKDYPAIQKEVREFHQSLYAKYAEKKTADRVYSFQNQLIPQTPRIKP